MEEKLYKVALGNLPNVGNKNSQSLLAYCGSAKQVFRTPKRKLLKIPGIGEVITNSILQKDTLLNAEQEIERAQKEGVQILFLSDDDYPKRLRHVYNAPPLIYYKGNTSLDSSRMIAVVGTRNVTDYGRQMVDKLISGLNESGVIIVSGLAYGIDICAHRAALKNNLPTIGVMANGIDQMYPWQHKKTSEQMILNGGLLTEEPFGTKPSAPRFPARNRIVAGLCDAILVVESAEKGGSLITANLAFDYDKEIFAVPGNINSRFSKGCNNLIKEHKAHLVTEPEDILNMMNWDLDESAIKSKPNKTPLNPADFSKDEIRILQLLEKRQLISKDELFLELEIPMHTLSTNLLNLEFNLHVECLPGNKFKLS